MKKKAQNLKFSTNQIIIIAVAVICFAIAIATVYFVKSTEPKYVAPEVIQTHEITYTFPPAQPAYTEEDNEDIEDTEAEKDSTTKAESTTAATSTTKEITTAKTETTTKPVVTTKPVATPAAKMPVTKSGIVSTYNLLMKNAKSIKNGEIKKTADTDTDITEMQAGLTRRMVNGAFILFRRPTTQTVKFTDGTSDTFDTADSIINPINKDINLKESGVESAKAVKSDNGYIIEIKLKEEKSHYNGDTSTKAPIHESCMDPFDVSEAGSGASTIIEADSVYHGAVIICHVDQYGRLTHYETSLPITSACTCSIPLRTFSATIETTKTESYDISYF